MASLTIDSVDPFSPYIQRISSPRSLQALQHLGLELKDLTYTPITEFLRLGLAKELAEQRYLHNEDRRAKYIADVKDKRREIIRNASGSPVRKDTENKAKTDPLRQMELKERRLLEKLHKHRERQLNQTIAAEHRQMELIKDLEDRKKREISKEKQRLERLRHKQRSVHMQKIALETLVPKRTPSKSPVLETKTEDAFDIKLKELQTKLEKRAVERKGLEEWSYLSERVEGRRRKATETEESLWGLSEHSVDLEERFRRHEAHMKHLRALRAQQLNDQLSQAAFKAERLKALQQEKQTQLETLRSGLAAREHSAEQRYLNYMKLKEEHYSELARKEAAKLEQSQYRRRLKHETVQARAESVLLDMQETEVKIAKRLENQAKERAIRREIQEEQRLDRYQQAQRLRKMEEYKRELTLTQLQAEQRRIADIQAAKRREKQLKQRLRKEIELEKKEIGEKFDLALTSKQTMRPLSLSPVRQPEASPPPVLESSLHRTTSSVSSGSKLEEVKKRHDRELMEQLRLEHERERERAEALAKVSDEQEALEMEARFQQERTLANQRIVALSE